MSMQVISWDEYVGSGESGEGSRDRCSDNSIPHSSLLTPHSSFPLAVAIGVFDGVHRGHQALIRRICETAPGSSVPTIVTFRQNPLKIFNPDGFFGEIYPLEQKLSVLESLGVQMVVLIDFSLEFSKINGRDFIDLLLKCRPVKLIALGSNFRCGHSLDTGVEEIQTLAQAKGTEVWVAPPVMDEGQPVSSSRIRQALAEGRVSEAERLMGRKIESIPPAFLKNGF